MALLLRPMELMSEIFLQLKSLCEANYAESILKHIIDQICQGMGKISRAISIWSRLIVAVTSGAPISLPTTG
jgi:hypothetical protein